MRELTSPRWIYAKGILFLVLGCLAAGSLLTLHPHWQVALLLAVAVWSFARFYYFAFYVIEHYVDGQYKFAGLGSFARYLLGKKRPAGRDEQDSPPDRAGG